MFLKVLLQVFCKTNLDTEFTKFVSQKRVNCKRYLHVELPFQFTEQATLYVSIPYMILVPVIFYVD